MDQKYKSYMKETGHLYKLEKSVWSDIDFVTMSWHDCMIYAISFGSNNQLLFDIDYIFRWVLEGESYKFWVSPCTLVFENVYDLEFQINNLSEGLQIDNVSRDKPQKPQNANFIGNETEYDWSIELSQGSIFFKSVGYQQYTRRGPSLMNGQYSNLKDRGGISFSTESTI